MDCLEKIFFQSYDDSKIEALFWIGEIGQINHLESLYFINLKKEEHVAARDAAIQKIIERPIDITVIHPSHFEKLMARLLEKKGFKNVCVTRPFQDQGVDIKMNSNKHKYFVQCKRYKFNSTINKKDLEKFYKSISTEEKFNENKYKFITTAHKIGPAGKYFTEEMINKNKWDIEIFCGEDLIEMLNKYFGDRKFCLENYFLHKNKEYIIQQSTLF